MKVEWLFFRWLLVIGLLAIGATYLHSWGESRPDNGYETIPLVRGERTSGLPVRGVMVDPDQRNIYAVVGGPVGSGEPADFFILWKGKNGETFSATFPKGDSGAAALCQISQDGQVRQLHDFQAKLSEEAAPARSRLANAEATLHTIVSNLAGNSRAAAKR
jgi:hypothetical protein